MLRDRDTGEKVDLAVVRDGQRKVIRVELGSRQTCSFDVGELVALEGLDKLEALDELDGLEALDALDDLEINVGELDIDGIIRASLATAAAGLHEAFESDEWKRELRRLKDLD